MGCLPAAALGELLQLSGMTGMVHVVLCTTHGPMLPAWLCASTGRTLATECLPSGVLLLPPDAVPLETGRPGKSVLPSARTDTLPGVFKGWTALSLGMPVRRLSAQQSGGFLLDVAPVFCHCMLLQLLYEYDYDVVGATLQ